MNPQEVKIARFDLKQGDTKVGEFAMLIGGINFQDPDKVLEDAVSHYVNNEGYNEYVDIHLDNPWVRVVVKGIDQFELEDFIEGNEKFCGEKQEI